MVSVFLLLCRAVSAFASDQIPDMDMHAMAREVLALQRYMFSEAEFTSPRNDTEIRNSFPVLEQHLARLKTKVFTESPALRANVSMLADQIGDADQAFQRGDKSYARYVLVSSLQMCVACHTRTASADFALPEAEMKGASTLDRANYLFATRQFDKGRALYEEYLAQPAKTQLSGLVRASSLALAIYYARVKIDPAGGKKYFATLAADKKFTAAQRKGFGAWAGAFAQWAGKPGRDGEALSDKEAMDQARALLRPGRGAADGEIRSLRASAFLNSVLEGPGETSPLKAEALLDLGGVYNSLNFPLYGRFGDMYLKACISDYAKSKSGQKCFEALDHSVKGRMRAGDGAAGLEEADLLKWKKRAY